MLKGTDVHPGEIRMAAKGGMAFAESSATPIINLGMIKTGTTSLHVALQWPDVLVGLVMRRLD